MKQFKKWGFLALALAVFGIGSLAQAAKVGEKAPDFTAADSNGKLHKLSDYKGRFVVLEWHNASCPFVRSAYKGKMQELQRKWTKKTVLWFSVISSAPGTEGYMQAAEANADVKKHHSFVSATFLDPKGTIGHAYDAKTTPHMFIIDPKGILVYDGAVDNAPLEDKTVKKNKDGEPYVNYVDRVLTEMLVKKGPAASIPTTAPYGCHVKYND